MSKSFAETLRTTIRSAISVLKPPPDLTVSQWADEHRMLSPEASAEPGRWVTDRAPYQRGIMDTFSDPDVEIVVIMSSAQVGKTEIVNNIVGFFIHQDPSPMLVVQPTLDMGQAWSKDRLAPMLRDSPALRGRVKDVKSRASDNTIMHKKFPGGHMTICGANSPSSLASRPIRVVLNDEVDRYPASAGAEGDPVKLAWKRTTTFWNRKGLLCSTPTLKGTSRIEVAFEESDKRYYMVPCPHCGEVQALKWANVKWPPGHPAAAEYQCEACGVMWSDIERRRALRKGFWKATAPFKGVAGFHLWEAYSPWSSLGRMAEAFEEARKQPETLKTFINTVLGETWEEDGSGVDPNPLMDRREDYGPKVPFEAAVLFAGVDTQDDRFEVEVAAFGPQNETWNMDFKVIHGDPSRPETQQQLLDYLRTPWTHTSGRKMMISGTGIDTQGHHTAAIQTFVKKYGRRFNIFALRGNPNPGTPMVGRPQKNNKLKVKQFPVGTATAKELIYSRLRVVDPGPGYCHFPVDRDEEYFAQLTAERVVTKWVRGRPTRVWEQTRKRNEALDCRVYALVAYTIVNPAIDKILARVQEPVEKAEEKPVEHEKPVLDEERVPEVALRRKPARRQSSSGFVMGWR